MLVTDNAVTPSRRVLPKPVMFALMLVAAMVLAARTSQAQTLNVLHNFSGGADGAQPDAGLAFDRAGNLYGTTYFGGGGNCHSGGCGGVFKLARKNGVWIFTPLYDFQGGDNDGASPMAPVTIGPDGAVYGVTFWGGGSGCGGQGCGTAFRLTPGASFCSSALCRWAETIIDKFQDDPNQITTPFGPMAFDSAGNIYGPIWGGASGNGAIYKLTGSGNSWTSSVIYSFTGGSDGAISMSRPNIDAAGNIYGTTTFGGSGIGFGTLFKLVHNGAGWTFNLLYSFQGGSDGGHPESGVVLDSAGNLYGCNTYGGQFAFGVVYEVNTTGTYSVIYNPRGSCFGDLAMDNAGNLYGTTYSGGSDDGGTIFELSPSGSGWTATILHSFAGPEGAYPMSSVIRDPSGNLYGTTTMGGNHNYGVAWQLMP